MPARSSTSKVDYKHSGLIERSAAIIKAVKNRKIFEDISASNGRIPLRDIYCKADMSEASDCTHPDRCISFNLGWVGD